MTRSVNDATRPRTTATTPRRLAPMQPATPPVKPLNGSSPSGASSSSLSLPDVIAAASPTHASSGEDASLPQLVLAISNRLARVEAQQQLNRAEILRKDEMIDALQMEIRELTARFNASTISSTESKLASLCDRVEAMESILLSQSENYMNSSARGSSAETAKQWIPGASAAGNLMWENDSSTPKCPYNMGAVLRRLGELTAVAEMDDPSKAKLQLKIYSDGIIVDAEKFRTFEDRSAQSFMEDILDGYFPFELKNRFPEGVGFIVDDQSRMSFADEAAVDLHNETQKTDDDVSELECLDMAWSDTENFDRVAASSSSTGESKCIRLRIVGPSGRTVTLTGLSASVTIKEIKSKVQSMLRMPAGHRWDIRIRGIGIVKNDDTLANCGITGIDGINSGVFFALLKK